MVKFSMIHRFVYGISGNVGLNLAFVLLSKDCLLETYMMFAGVRVHGHC